MADNEGKKLRASIYCRVGNPKLKNGGYDTSTETARSFRVCMEFRLFVCKICNLWYLIYVYILKK